METIDLPDPALDRTAAGLVALGPAQRLAALPLRKCSADASVQEYPDD